MIRIVATVLFFAIYLHSSNAQQLPLFTQYSENQGYINPAGVSPNYLLFGYDMNFSVMHRSQWVSIPNHPMTSAISAEIITETKGAFNFVSGGYIINDRVGPISTTGLYGRIAGINTGKYYNTTGFSVGILGGIVQYRVDELTQIADDPTDPLLPIASVTQFYPDIGIGVSFFHQFDRGWAKGDNLYIGLSIPQVFGLNVSLRNEDQEFSYERTRHFYGSISYYRFVGESKFFEFSTWIKYVMNAPLSVDGNIRYRFSEIMWIGVGASTSGVGNGEIGFLLGQGLGLEDAELKVSYGYNPAFTTFGDQFGNTHELNLIYSLSTYK